MRKIYNTPNERFYKGDACRDCSKPITIKNKSGLCRSCGKKGNTLGTGWVMSDEQRAKLSLDRLGAKNPNWKGDEVGLNALHGWLKARLLKPKLCNHCGLVPPCDLANKGIYNRDFVNWEWLCRKCHMLSDGRMENLHRGKN